MNIEKTNAQLVILVNPNVQLLTTKETAVFFNLKESWVRRMASNGNIPFIKMGRKIRFDKKDLLDFIETCRINRGY